MATTFTTVVNNYVQAAMSSRSIGGTSLVVSSVAGLPILSSGQFMRLSVLRNNAPVTILKVTGVTPATNTLTIAGALEVSDADVMPNDVVMIADTAGLFTEVQSAVNNIETGTTHLALVSTGGTTSRILNDRFSDFYNAKDFGVVGDGVTDDASAINALLTYVITQPSFKPRTIYFPAGNYAVGSRINIARSVGSGLQTSSVHIVGDGYQTQFFNKTTLTEIIRIEDSAQGIFEKFRVLCQNPVTVAALHNTAVLSGETNSFHNITVDCANQCPVGIGISLDYDNDVAQIQFTECKVSNATKAGYMMGNGTSGNVLDLRFLFCQALHCNVGVWMDAAPVLWYGGAVTTSTISDFFMSGGSGGPTVIESVRSENSNMFFLSRGGGSVPPIRISDIQCSDFIGQTYNYDDPTQTFSSVGEVVEGFVISHRFSGVMTIMNCCFWHGPSQYPGGRLNVSSDCHVAVINCEIGAAGQTANQLRSSLYAAGGTSGKLNFSVVGGKTVTSGATQYLSPIDILCDGPAFFNDTVAINTMSPTSGYHQVGGSFYLQKIPDPVAGPTVVPTGTGSTSYTYYYTYVDSSGNTTLVSPGTTVTNAATLDSTHYNTITIPNPGVNVTAVDILRGSTTQSIITDWDPYVSSPTFVYVDSVNGTSAYPAISRNTTADMVVDGNINISDASGFLVTSTGSTTGRTLAARFASQWINALDFGVTGDGITDDQPAIMALLKYVSNLSNNTGFRRTIYFPAGSYNIGSASNSQGIMVGKRFMQKGDGTYPAGGSPWTGINLIGEGYSTQFISNCPTGLTEIMRLEDTGISRVQGMRFWVHPGKPVTTAALHVTAIASGENHVIEDVTVEIQPYGPFAVTLTNGLTSVSGSGFDSTMVGKYMYFSADATRGTYQVQAVNSSVSLTLATVYNGTSGSQTGFFTQDGDGCPVGIGLSVDYNNDTAQVHLNGCKVSGADYAGYMLGGGNVGNVLDIRFKNCQSLQNPIGVFGWAAPIVWDSGITAFNHVADFYMAGAAGGPTFIGNVRSEGSNRFYVNGGGGTSTSPTTLSTCTISSWSGITYTVNSTGAPPFYPMNVTVSNATPAVVTGTNTFFVDRGPPTAGGKVVFHNDPNHATYTIGTVDSNTQLTLTTAYSGPTGVATTMGMAAPVFTMSTQAGVTGSQVVTTTNGSATVTGPAGWAASLTTNHYLIFDNDPNFYFYGVKTIVGDTVTLDVNAKGNTVYIGPSGQTTVKCGLVEGYGLVSRCGGSYTVEGMVWNHSPKPYFSPRWNFSATQAYVTAIGNGCGAATSSNQSIRDAQFLNNGVNQSGTNFLVLPGPGNTSTGSLFQNNLGFLCGYQANFQRPISVGAFLVDPTAGYHQQGGSMRLQALPDPGSGPTVAVQGSTGSTNYYYRFVFRDQAGNVTMSSPSSAHVTTSQVYTSFTSSNYNKITIPFTYQTSNASYVDIIRTTGDGTDGASWVNVVNTNVTSAIQFGSTWSWNPWVTNSPTSNSIVFNDQSTTSPAAYTLPTRNMTADLTIDGYHLPTYAGSGGTEINGAQTATIVADATTQKMVQTLWNMARTKGLIA